MDAEEKELVDVEVIAEITGGPGSSGVIANSCFTSSESRLILDLASSSSKFNSIPGFSGGLGLSVSYPNAVFLLSFCRTMSDGIRSTLTTGFV